MVLLGFTSTSIPPCGPSLSYDASNAPIYSTGEGVFVQLLSHLSIGFSTLLDLLSVYIRYFVKTLTTPHLANAPAWAASSPQSWTSLLQYPGTSPRWSPREIQHRLQDLHRQPR